RDGSIRDPHADGALPGERGSRHQTRGGKHHRVGTREETPQQAESIVVDDGILRHLAQIAAEEREGLAGIAALEKRHALDGLLLEEIATDRVVRVGRVAHQPARIEHRDRARDVPRLRVHRVDRLDGSAPRHRAMLRARHERRKKSGGGRSACPRRQRGKLLGSPAAKRTRRPPDRWTAAYRRGRKPCYSPRPELMPALPVGARPSPSRSLSSVFFAAARPRGLPCSINSRTFWPPL